MIITCINCETQFFVDDEALGGVVGRRVRCASCGNTWRYEPDAATLRAAVVGMPLEPEEPPPPSEAAPADAAAPAAEPAQVEVRPEVEPASEGPVAQPRPSVSVELPAAAREVGKRLTGLSLIVGGALLVVLAIVARDVILTLWPSTAPVYETFRLAEPPTAGLEVTVTPTRTADSVIINGDIVNSAKAVRRIPRLRVTLRDGYKTDLESKVIAPPVERLPPGATAHFNTVFEHPSITAIGVEVSFASQ